MVKKVMKGWKTIKFEEFGGDIANADFEGLAGFEECYEYGVESSKSSRKRKQKNEETFPPKKTKTEVVGSFTVETLNPNANLKPSRDNAELESKKKQKNKNDKPLKKKKPTKKSQNKKEVIVDSANAIPLEDMQAWSSFGIPESVLRALADQGFKQPTSIQELTLSAAMHGRRDILGAAETGSGKTLAFGIPIITGILNFKEKAAKGEDDFIPDDQVMTKKKELVEIAPKIVNLNKLSKKEIKKLKGLKNTRKNIRKNVFKKLQDSDDDCIESDEEDSDESGDESDTLKGEDDVSGNEDNESLDEEDNESLDDEDNESLDDNVNETLEASDEENSDQDSDEAADINSDEEISELDSDGEEQANESEDQLDSPNDKPDDEELKEYSNIMSNEIDNGIIPQPIKNPNLKPLYALILTPTRELAIQVKNHLVAAAKYTDIRIAVVVGGMAHVKQERVLAKGPEIVVATPGRLWDFIQMGNEHLSQVTDIRFLGIDETDRMIERGHYEELHHLLDKVNDNEYKRMKRQNFVFSATLTMVHDLPFHLKTRRVNKKGKLIKKRIERLTSEQKLKKLIELLGISDPKVVDVTVKNQGSSTTLTECRIMCPIDQKDFYLYYVLKRHPGRTIVFCNSIGCVKRLSQLFGLLQCNPLPLHASMQQRQRLKNLDRFRNNQLGLLIATDVAARGLDIPDIENVIHYQVPRTAENYVHRSGRTARANKEGIAILIMEPGEVQYYTRMCRTLSKAEDLPHFPIFDAVLSATKMRVNLARELDQLELHMRKANSELGWYEKSMKEMDILLDDNEKPRKLDTATAMEQKSLLSMKKKRLNQLLATHLFPTGFSYKFPTSNDSVSKTLAFGRPLNALETMKSAIEAKLVKKGKKNTEETQLVDVNNYNNLRNKNPKEKGVKNGKINKNKWKKMKRNENIVKN